MRARSIAFADRYPALFHVTRASALAGIARHGLRPTGEILAALGLEDTVGSNRDTWTSHTDHDGSPVWLRWQCLRDHVLRSRLPATMEPSVWRRFINSMVFLFPSWTAAERLRCWRGDVGLDQVVLRYPTAALIEAGCELRVCRYNNGFPDRQKVRRLRLFSDYRPIAEWRRGDPIKEITVAGAIPPGVAFDIVQAGAPTTPGA